MTANFGHTIRLLSLDANTSKQIVRGEYDIISNLTRGRVRMMTNLRQNIRHVSLNA